MSFTYILSDNGKLQKKGETLQLWSPDGSTTILFPFKTEQIVILGNVEITGAALRLLMRHNIDTVFLGTNGRFNGRLAFQESKNVFLRQKQFSRLADERFVLNLSRSIVRGKLRNELSFMQRIKRKKENEADLEASVSRIKRTIEQVEEADSVEKIRGLEGIGARHYFAVFRHNIVQPWASFPCRSMHPPETNVNAVLSFLYTLLLYRVDAALEIEGLDSYVGYFHALEYGRRSLALDLLEEYRTPIADTLCCALFNLGVLEPEDFREVIFSSTDPEFPLEAATDQGTEDSAVVYQEKKGVLLTKAGLKKVIAQFEKKMDTAMYYTPLGQQLSYRRIIIEQVRHFKRVLDGEEAEYKPLAIK